jgi:hypothetical protein
VQARLVYPNLTKLELRDTVDGSTLDLPKITAGEIITFSMRLTEEINGSSVLVQRPLHALKASIGRPDIRPESGGVMLQIGTGSPDPGVNQTPAIAHNATADQVASAINALSAAGLAAKLPCQVKADNGSWLVLFKDKSQVSITCIENSLWPVSFVEMNVISRDGGFVHELRFTQTPAASTVQFANLVQEAPSITRIRAGSNIAEIKVNEVQKLTIPPGFTGAFTVLRSSRPSKTIGLPTSGQEISNALKQIADEDGVFVITEEQDAVLIEFTESMGAGSQPLLEVQVLDAHPGDPTFVLDTNTDEIWTLMRRIGNQGEMRVILSVDLFVPDEQDDEVSRQHSFQIPVTLVPPVNREVANVAASLVWNQPPSRTRIKPFSPNNLLITTHAYPEVVGDGTATSFVINHNLGSNYLTCTARENSDGGRELIHGTDFTVIYTNANSATITFPTAIANESVLATIKTTDLASTWAPGVTWEITDINGLEDALLDYGQRIGTLESLVSLNVLTSDIVSAANEVVAQWKLPIFGELYPTRAKIEKLENLENYPYKNAGRLGGLYAAVHDATIETLTVPLPAVAGSLKGRVFKNETGNDVTLNAALAHQSVVLAPNDYAACDGRAWYRVNQYGTEKTFYPSAFDRELFVIAVNEDMLRQKKSLQVGFGLQLALFGAKTNAQWVVVIEHGTFSSESNPATTGQNLKAVVWNTTPLLSRAINITRDPVVHTFGCRIARSLQVISGTPTDVITSSKILYGAESGTTGPTTANFALRAGLIRFDIEDSVSDPKAFVGLIGLAPQIEGASSETLGLATIK